MQSEFDPNGLARHSGLGPQVVKIVSGAQTGADRAALDVAIRWGMPHGGWCPKDRRAKDGPIGGQYLLKETPSHNYIQRTEWNVRDSDATVIFTKGEPSGVTLKTFQFARKHGKPCLLVWQEGGYQPVVHLQRFLADHGVQVLNVAGSRESKSPGIYLATYDLLEQAIFWVKAHPDKIGGPGEG